MQHLWRRARAKFLKWTERRIKVPVEPLVPTERLGTPYGGWIIPQNWFDERSICYLVGAGEDISFDLDLVKKYRCEAWIIDPTPRAEAHFQQWYHKAWIGEPMTCATSPTGFYPAFPADLFEKITYAAIGLWHETTRLRFFSPQNDAHVSHSLVNLQRSEKFIEVLVKRLSELMRDFGHTRLDLLKLDIEGAEYQVIDSILEDGIEIDVLCIEYDETAANHLDSRYQHRIEASLHRLREAGYRIIAKEPDCHNYTLVHQRRLAP